MHFAVVSVFLPTEEVPAIAVAADELGYRSLTVADHVVDLERISTPYPYEADGQRRWDATVEWPDPWVLIGSLAARTTRLRFFTSIYVAALRNPYLVAKSVGTASVLSGGRVSLGVGVGWCKEEFDLLGQDFATRGRRTDEGFDLLRALWSPGWTEHDGEFYAAPKLVMRPQPAEAIPILVGGLSDIALRRAARNDGWIGDVCTTDEAIAFARRLHEFREEEGREGRFEIVPALSDAILPEDFARAADAGVTEVMTVPWAYYYGRNATLEQKIEGLHRFREDVMVPLGSVGAAT
jgi:probable F420-dependent oxidoreductase